LKAIQVYFCDLHPKYAIILNKEKQKGPGMPRKIISFLIFFMLAALPAHGENAMDYYNLGLKSTITPTKIKYFSKALELDPNLAEAYEKRGMLYFFQNQFDNVIQDFQAYIRLAPPKAEAYQMLGLGYLKNGFHEQAIDIFTRAIELDPQMTGAYSYRAEAYRLIGMIDEALRDCAKAIELRRDPQSIASAYSTRAMIYRQLGQDELSEADFHKSYEMDQRFYVFGFFVLRYFDNTPSPDTVSRVGLVTFVIISFVVIFGLALRTPAKKE